MCPLPEADTLFAPKGHSHDNQGQSAATPWVGVTQGTDQRQAFTQARVVRPRISVRNLLQVSHPFSVCLGRNHPIWDRALAIHAVFYVRRMVSSIIFKSATLRASQRNVHLTDMKLGYSLNFGESLMKDGMNRIDCGE
jgi:hypothetical protein